MRKIAIGTIAVLFIVSTKAFAGRLEIGSAALVSDNQSKPLNKSQPTPYEKVAIGHPYLSVLVDAGFAKIVQ